MKRFKMLTAIVMVVGFVLCFSGQVWAEDPGPVNINTASAKELATLNKVGPKTADRIIEYRSNVSKFKTPEELMNVKGIGKKTFEINKDRIVVGVSAASSEKPGKAATGNNG